MLTEWCSSIEYRVVHPEHVVRWRLHIACKGLAGILQKHYANCILITRDYSQLYLRFSATCLERNSWYVLWGGGRFKITTPHKALILPLKARLIILHVNPVHQRHFFVVFRRLVKNETTRKSVYIIAKGWPKITKRDKASMLLQRTGPKTFVSPNDFIHYPLTPDFVVFAKIGHPKNYIKRQSVYILPKKWTKRFFWVIFSRKIDAYRASFAPSPLTLRGDKSLRDCDVRCLRSSKKLSGYAPLKWSRSNG